MPFIPFKLEQAPTSNRTTSSNSITLGGKGPAVLESVAAGIVTSSGRLAKGECYLEVSLQDSVGVAIARLFRGYLYNGNDLSWTGSVHVDAGYQLNLISWNSNANLTLIVIRGQLFS